MQSSWADGHVKVWKYSISGTESVHAFRVQLMIRYPAVWYIYLCLARVRDGVYSFCIPCGYPTVYTKIYTYRLVSTCWF